MAKYQSTHTGAEIDAGIDLLDNNSATSGQVLTANGTGGASWQNASGGASIGGGYTLTFGNTGLSPNWWILGGKTTFTNSEGVSIIQNWFGWHTVSGFSGTCENAIMFSTDTTSYGIGTISGNLYFSDGTKLSSSTSSFDNKLILLHSDATLITND